MRVEYVKKTHYICTSKSKTCLTNNIYNMNTEAKMKATFEDIETYWKMIREMDSTELGEERDRFVAKLNEFVESRDWYPTVFEENGKFGLKDLDGRLMVPAVFDSFCFLESRLYEYPEYVPVAVSCNDRYGIVETDGTGKMVLPCEHDNVAGLVGSSDIFWVTDGGKTGLCDGKGEYLIPQIADKVFDPVNEVIVFKVGDKFGLYDFGTSLYVEPLYDWMEAEPDQAVRVVKGDKTGYLSDVDGRFVSDGEYESDEYYDGLIFASSCP